MAELQHLMVSGQQQHGNGKTFAQKHQQTNEPKHQNTKHQQTKTPTYQTGHFLRQKQTQTKRKILEEYKNWPRTVYEALPNYHLSIIVIRSCTCMLCFGEIHQ